MSLEQPSKIFFLIGCSNSKAGPDDVYRPESEAVRPGFSRSLVTEPLRDRKNVFDLLQRSRAKRAGIQLLALPYNRELRIGPDVKLRLIFDSFKSEVPCLEALTAVYFVWCHASG